MNGNTLRSTLEPGQHMTSMLLGCVYILYISQEYPDLEIRSRLEARTISQR